MKGFTVIHGKRLLFRGVATALATPMKKGEVDFDALRTMLDYQKNGGVDAVVLCGTTGEAPTLCEEECCAILDCARAHLGNDFTIIMGTGTNCTESTLRRSRDAAAHGADALLLVTPYYNKGTFEGVFRHYMRVANEIELPLILYNVPSRTGVDLSLSQLQRLAAHSRIVALKEACGNFDKMARFMHDMGDSLTLYSGNDTQILPTLALGGMGVISVISCVLPRLTTLLCRAYFEGNHALACKLQSQLLPLADLLFAETNPAPVKAALSILGLCENELRLPLACISDDLYHKLEEELSRMIPLERTVDLSL